MKPTSSQRDREIIEILESLRSLEEQYPPELLAARRAAFLSHIQSAQQDVAEVQEAKASQDQEIIRNLESLKSVEANYPSELLAARRAAFIGQIAQRGVVGAKEAQAAQNQEILKTLESLKSLEPEYPSELLAARRAAFIGQVIQRGEEVLASQDENVIRLLQSLKSAQPGYPPKLLAARRSAFVRQVAGWSGISLLEVLRSTIRRTLAYKPRISLAPMMNVMRPSLVIAGMILAAFVGSLMGNRNLFNPAPTANEISRPIPAPATSTQGLVRTTCEPGYLPPLCLEMGADNDNNLTFQGNGVARAAVAKDSLPGDSGIHKAAFANDGLYGNGKSWISNSAYSWIKIDLGKMTNINTVTFGRDRLGNYNDRDPGQFTIAVALSDNVYADGNSSKDSIEYTLVYDSERAGFDGSVSTAETVQAYFGSVTARFVKITFTNPGTAIDEVEVFLVQPAFLSSARPTQRTKDRSSRATSTNLPTSTPQPSNTPTDIPTDTPQPTNTPTDIPTDTPLPTDPPTLIPLDTPTPEPTP